MIDVSFSENPNSAVCMVTATTIDLVRPPINWSLRREMNYTLPLLCVRHTDMSFTIRIPKVIKDKITRHRANGPEITPAKKKITVLTDKTSFTILSAVSRFLVIAVKPSLAFFCDSWQTNDPHNRMRLKMGSFDRIVQCCCSFHSRCINFGHVIDRFHKHLFNIIVH